ncbi:MAG: hypothetical protein ACREQM_19000 [Candidatus Dormibacteraceae bacterium]
MKHSSGTLRRYLALVAAMAAALATSAVAAGPAAASAGTLKPQPIGELDCNGDSPIQTSVHHSALCTDIRGYADEQNANTWDGRFYDNGVYIGHDEPDMVFESSRPGSGNDVSWTATLPVDPRALPTVHNPGSDVVRYFEDSPAPWLGMAMCDPNSAPQTPCTPESDANAPTCVGISTTNCFDGGGSAFMEFQLYPPGMPPFVDSVSCDDSHWCAALTIDSLECQAGVTACNAGCEEPANFGYIQRNGVPTGPPSPQEADLQTYTPNAQTLLMNPGDTLQIHMFDAPAPGGGQAFKVMVTDLRTGQSGWMQSSAANGFATTSPTDCSGTPFNFQPEYSTASPANIVPWAADLGDVSEAVETGHFEACTKVTSPASYPLTATLSDTYWNVCKGPYEANDADESATEPSDAFCYPFGDTHGALATQPDLVTGCEDNLEQNGDLDFDGTPYYQSDWPVGSAPTWRLPSSFVEQLPTSGGRQYPSYYVQTDVALSESDCSGTTGAGCTVPPQGPGGGYPYYSHVGSRSGCTLEFGNVNYGPGVDNLGGEAQYGSLQLAKLGYQQFVGPTRSNGCGGFQHHRRS